MMELQQGIDARGARADDQDRLVGANSGHRSRRPHVGDAALRRRDREPTRSLLPGRQLIGPACAAGNPSPARLRQRYDLLGPLDEPWATAGQLMAQPAP
jgi:hypothetical protein